MALTPSNMLPLGTIAPDFELPDGHQTLYTRDGVKRELGLMVAFICNHCPYVIHLKAALAELGRQLESWDIGMVAINSNDIVNYPADAPNKMLEDVAEYDYTFPYLFDESQAVARAYDAACTPDFYLFDKDLALVYRGQFDGSRPGGSVPVTGEDLYRAINVMLRGEVVADNQTPSMGCNIKWK